MNLITHVCAEKFVHIPKMNDENVLKSALEGIKFEPGKHRELFVPTVVHVHLDKRHVRDLASVSKADRRCTSQRMRITIFESVHWRPFLTQGSEKQTSQ